MGSRRLHAIHGQMQSKGGYEAAIEVTITMFMQTIRDNDVPSSQGQI